jgi:hypothetical protein
MKRAQIAENLEHIYQARNRLAHHEPVLHKRFRDAIAAIEFVGTVSLTNMKWAAG